MQAKAVVDANIEYFEEQYMGRLLVLLFFCVIWICFDTDNIITHIIFIDFESRILIKKWVGILLIIGVSLLKIDIIWNIYIYKALEEFSFHFICM